MYFSLSAHLLAPLTVSRTVFTRSGKQSEIGRSARPRGFLSFYHWEFRLTLNVIARILREVVNRVKLGDQHARRGSRGEVQSRVVRRRDRDRDRDSDRDRDGGDRVG